MIPFWTYGFDAMRFQNVRESLCIPEDMTGLLLRLEFADNPTCDVPQPYEPRLNDESQDHRYSTRCKSSEIRTPFIRTTP
jgi:hypothetical protein